jgi:CheY-like chemotaxis protein/anti-sigma regulatory factor (Ser/Thr protein kinase)
VDDLLDISRVTRGKVDLRLSRVEIAEVVAKALEMSSPLFERRRHHVSLAVPPRGLAVEADATRLAQVLSNILTNAARYTPPGGHIAIDARNRSGRIVVTITDDGIGIEPEVLPRIFDLFVQGERKLDRSEGGLGLGLSIARSLTALHGGSLTARSEGPGKGSEFVMELPACALQDVSTPSASPESVGASGAANGRRVLVVDDNTDAAELLADFLRAVGHEARVAHDGPTALREVPDFRPDTALLDIGLPVMDGYELARRLRELNADVQLIAITGYGQTADRRRAAEAGFDRHLVKPIQLEVLQDVIEERNRRQR